MADHFYFSETFQDSILACLMRCPSKFIALAHILKPSYFWGVNSTKICEIILDFHAEHKRFPDFGIIEDYVRDHYGRDSQDLADEAIAYVKKLAKANVRNADYIKSKFIFFCRERALIKAIQDSAEQIRSGKWPESGFAVTFDQAMRVGRDMEQMGFRMYEDADKVVDMVTAETYGVKTGYALLDKIWHNGWGRGWLVTPIAPPKGRKSTWCINLALNMTSSRLGKNAVNVHYYACELSAELALARAYCRVAKQSMKTLYRDTELFRAAMHDGLEKTWKDGGKLLAKTFPSKMASIADIRAHALMAIEALDWHPQVIFIDHAETIRAPKVTKDMSDWRSQAEVYTQARALASELDCVVVMPDRCNKETVGQDVPNITSFQGSFEKAGIVDVAIGLCQTEIEYVKNQMRYFVFVNRHGPQFDYFRGTVNRETMAMSIDHPLDFEMERKKFEDEKDRRRQDRRARGKSLPPQLEE